MILCFDIGGSRIKAALAKNGHVTLLGDVPTPLQDFAAFFGALRTFMPQHQIGGVAISIAGVVDPESGAIRVANIPCADGRHLALEISNHFGLPVIILNDADCFALAEARQGAGRGHRNVFGIILGTGVGGGLIIDGQVVRGAGGFAGEWGHGPVLHAPYDFPCGCGLRGCIDAVCGARGLEKLHQFLGAGKASSTDILDLWLREDQAGVKTVSTWLDLVSPPLAMVLNVVGASVVPVGGGLSNNTRLVAALDVRVRSLMLWQSDRPILIPAICQPEPGLIGAAEAGHGAFG